MVYPIRFPFLLALLLLGSFAFGATEERVTKETFKLNEGGTVSLSNVNGDVTIRGWDKQEVDMKATKRGPASQLDEVEILIDSTPERLSINTKYPKRKKDNRVSVSYQLMVPKNSTLDAVETVNGEIEVTGVEGDIYVHTVNGSAELEGVRSSLHAETVNGNITSKWVAFPDNGKVEMETVNGSLELSIPHLSNATVNAELLNGSIQTDFPITVQGKFSSRTLSGQIGNGGTNIDLSTVNGSIDILKAQQ